MKNTKKIQISIFTTIIFLSSTLLLLDVWAAPLDPVNPPNPPINNSWDIEEGEVYGWHVSYLEGDGPPDQDFIYNISEIRLIQNAFELEGTKYDAYGVQLKRMFWNANGSIDSLNYYENFINDYPVLNVSLMNFSTGIPGSDDLMFPFDPEMGGTIPLPDANLFITINETTNDPDLAYCADMLYMFYNYLLSGGMIQTTELSLDTDDSTYWMINYTNPVNETYAYLYYDENGVLITGEIYGYHDLDKYKVNYTSITDFNPINEVEWAYEEEDVFYMGQTYHEFRYKILEINETTILQDDEIFVTYQEVWANRTRWDGGSLNWTDPDIAVHGRANDFDPMVFTDEGPAFTIIPKGTKGCDIKQHWEAIGEHCGQVDSSICGKNWVRLYNSNNASYLYVEYFPNGQLKYLHTYSVNFMGSNKTVMYYKNSTIVNGADNLFEFTPYGLEGEIKIKLIISVSTPTQILFSAFHYLPIEDQLENGLIYIDIWLNDTSSLIEMKISIIYEGILSNPNMQKLQLGPSVYWTQISHVVNDKKVEIMESGLSFTSSYTIYGLSGVYVPLNVISSIYQKAFENAFTQAIKNAIGRAITRVLERKVKDFL